MCNQATTASITPSSSSSRSMKLSPKMVTVLQFCALCCLHVACQPCAASHAGGHRSLASSSHDDITSEWSIMDDTSNSTDTSDSDAKWVHSLQCTCEISFIAIDCVMLMMVIDWECQVYLNANHLCSYRIHFCLTVRHCCSICSIHMFVTNS